jgi:hypothetical protein
VARPVVWIGDDVWRSLHVCREAADQRSVCACFRVADASNPASASQSIKSGIFTLTIGDSASSTEQMPRRAPLGDDTALIFNASGDKAEVHQWHFYRCDAVWHDSSRT